MTNLFEVCYFIMVHVDIGGGGSRSTYTHAVADLIHIDKDINNIFNN